MKAELKSREACLYLVGSGLGLVRIGVATDANQRLRELQVGSPVRLRLVLTHPYADRRDARGRGRAVPALRRPPRARQLVSPATS